MAQSVDSVATPKMHHTTSAGNNRRREVTKKASHVPIAGPVPQEISTIIQANGGNELINSRTCAESRRSSSPLAYNQLLSDCTRATPSPPTNNPLRPANICLVTDVGGIIVGARLPAKVSNWNTFSLADIGLQSCSGRLAETGFPPAENP